MGYAVLDVWSRSVRASRGRVASVNRSVRGARVSDEAWSRLERWRRAMRDGDYAMAKAIRDEVDCDCVYVEGKRTAWCTDHFLEALAEAGPDEES